MGAGLVRKKKKKMQIRSSRFALPYLCVLFSGWPTLRPYSKKAWVQKKIAFLCKSRLWCITDDKGACGASPPHCLWNYSTKRLCFVERNLNWKGERRWGSSVGICLLRCEIKKDTRVRSAGLCSAPPEFALKCCVLVLLLLDLKVLFTLVGKCVMFEKINKECRRTGYRCAFSSPQSCLLQAGIWGRGFFFRTFLCERLVRFPSHRKGRKT